MRVGVSKELVKVLTASIWEIPHEGAVVSVVNEIDESRVWFANQVCDHHHLLLLSLRGEQRLATNQLSQDAANTPNINRGGILLGGKDDFRCAVPPRGDIVCHDG